MSLTDVQRLEQDFRELEKRVNEQLGGATKTTLGAPEQSQLDPTPVPATPAKPAQDQQLQNGDFSWSVNGYYEAIPSLGDKAHECAAWFSNDSVVDGQSLSFVNALTSSANKALKDSSHSNYDPAYCDWDSSQGCARMQGTKSLDAQVPDSPAFPGRIEYVGGRIALRNSQIIVPAGTHMGAYLYDNKLGSEVVMRAGAQISLSATVRGTPASPTERRYKVFYRTDRGYSLLTEEVIVANAPGDSDFATCDVELSWEAITGVIEAQIFRHDISAGKYRRLFVVSSGGTTYGDNGHVDAGYEDTGGYPAATDSTVRCYAATADGDLDNLPVNGVSAEWTDLWLNIPVPGVLSTTGRGNQVFRLQLDTALDRLFDGLHVSSGVADVTTTTDQFTPLDNGRTVQLTSQDGLSVLTTTATFVSTKHLTLAASPTWTDNNTVLYVVGGGDHGLLIDLIHLGWVERAKFAKHPNDLNKTLSPSAAPNESGQGGIGTGGNTGDSGDGGIVGCVPTWCPVGMLHGNNEVSIPFGNLRRGMALLSGSIQPNFTKDVLFKKQVARLLIVKFRNGVEVPCSAGQPFITSAMDGRGVAAGRLHPGDVCLTMKYGRLERSQIVDVVRTQREERVGVPSLSPGHLFIAGSLRLSFWQQIRDRLAGQQGVSGAILHNAKNEGDQQVF